MIKKKSRNSLRNKFQFLNKIQLQMTLHLNLNSRNQKENRPNQELTYIMLVSQVISFCFIIQMPWTLKNKKKSHQFCLLRSLITTEDTQKSIYLRLPSFKHYRKLRAAMLHLLFQMVRVQEKKVVVLEEVLFHKVLLQSAKIQMKNSS